MYEIVGVHFKAAYIIYYKLLHLWCKLKILKYSYTAVL